MKHLYFIRHGETEWNAERRMQGQWNSNLNALGRKQAKVNGLLMEGLEIDALFASPLDRTRQTAEIINTGLQLPITFDDRLKEWDCGDWSGFLYADIQTRWPDEWAAWQADHFHYRPPQAENYVDMIERVEPFLAELRDHPGRSIAIVSHGMIGRVMVSLLLGHGEEEMLSYHQRNDVVFRVTLDGEATRLAHFEGGNGPIEGITSHQPRTSI